MSLVTMYTAAWCPFCRRAADYLHRKGVEHIEKVAVDEDPAARAAMIARTGRTSVPQIFIGNLHVGGYDDLLRLDREGTLESLLGSDIGSSDAAI